MTKPEKFPNAYALMEQQSKQPVPTVTLKETLEEKLMEVARKAVADYVTLLVESKKQELKEQLDKETEILNLLQEIKAEVTKSNANLDLERDVLLNVNKELART